MPLLSQILLSAIITPLIFHKNTQSWTRTPLPSPSLVHFHDWFISEWNMGLYPPPKHPRRHRQQPAYPDPIPGHNTLPMISSMPEQNSQFAPWASNLPTKEFQNRTTTDNNELLALLFSLTTLATDRTFSFGTDAERICIDTGASACISTKCSNFISLQKVTDIMINGIGFGLPVEGIGTLKWPMLADNGTEMDIHIHQALYVPSAPMGLLCPQQIAMQTK
jgi:hypothetical protein